MDAAAIVNTAPVPIQPILRKLGVILFKYGRCPYPIDSNSAADVGLHFLVAPTFILLVAGDRDVLSTIREQKYLLHHRSHCRYRHRPQITASVLAQG